MISRDSIRGGLIAGAITIYAILLGLTSLFGNLVSGWFGFTSRQPGVLLSLMGIGFVASNLMVRRALPKSWLAAVGNALVIGVLDGALVGAFIWLVSRLASDGAQIRRWLVQLTPDNLRLLTLGQSPLVGGLLILALITLASAAGGVLFHLSATHDWASKRKAGGDRVRASVLGLSPVRRVQASRYTRQILLGAAFVVLALTPLVAGQYWNYTLGTVGIYVILGLGLNIVVGLAGLLDLGYVAFFAIGSFTVAILTAPQPHSIMMNYWLTIPIAVVLAATAGTMLGSTVLRMRGDYLAIVTLGFGEIIRVLSRSDVLTGFTGGPRGIRAVGGPSLFGVNLQNPTFFMYFIMFGIAMVAYITFRLQNSRVGRAWMAMREDQDVAEAMGVNILKYKLMAFATGAAFAGFAGAIFASRNRFTGPEDFVLLVSINVLCLVIIGGMGSIPGVVLGALVLKGVPEILRQLDDYRMLAFGALLVIMMIVRPEGLWPSKRHQLELHGEAEAASASKVPERPRAVTVAVED